MSKTKSWVMDSEVTYWATAEDIVKECQTFDEFRHRMASKWNLVAWYEAADLAMMLSDFWADNRRKS